MDLQEVKQFLKENADKDDVKAYLAEFQTDEDQVVKKYKESQDFKSEIDRETTKAIKTYGDKTVPKLIEEKVKEKETELELKYNPPKDPTVEALRKQIDQMQTENQEKEKARVKAERMNFLHENIKPEYKSFVKLVDGSLEDDEAIVEYLNKTAYDFSLLQKTTTPQRGDSSSKGQWTREDLKTKTPEEINEARREGKLDNVLGRN